ncbi:MAG: hypothetical protein IJQ15_11355 [Synergistaceae bacterium]|nr:hypothetical protein [Synergistaceae bacterium]
MEDDSKIIAMGEFCRSLKVVYGIYLDAQDAFDDDRKILRSIKSLGKALGVVEEKALKILARLLYGYEADMYTPEQVLRDYESNYRSALKSGEIIRDYADDMYNLLFEVMKQLEGSAEHSQLVTDIGGLLDDISSEQSKYL